MPSYGLGRREAVAFDFNLPSGNVCRMKRADLQAMIESGVIDSIDALTSMVQTEHVERVKKGKTKERHIQRATGVDHIGPEARAAIEIMKDKKRWAELESVVNAVVVQCVFEPQVLPIPAHEGGPVPEGYVRAEAGDDKFYVDEVSLTDRLAIFGEAMSDVMAGQAAMKPFRSAVGEALASVEDGADVQRSS